MRSETSDQVSPVSGPNESDFSDFDALPNAVAALPLDDASPPVGVPITTNMDTQSLGLSDPTLSQARRRQLDAINRLHSLGAQLDVDIPQIVVIGSQSAGKSSLIESISGITLPRASGTCTRSPTEILLVHSNEQWQCSVALRFMTDELEHNIDQVRNVPFGQPIRNPQDVEERLRRAQRAVLNPRVNPNRFLEDNYPSTTNELNFTTNCVSVEIRGSDVTDLSFCDLPGLIASVSDPGRDGDVDKVTQLVSSYISKQNCVILLTVACESDFETQAAYRLAKQYDKHGTRTIGVLTKPDRIPIRDETQWLKLIKNESSKLQNGWFCVKQPSTVELEEGLTFQEARRRGEEFFRTEPWSLLEGKHRRRLGSRALTQKLNEFLMALISKRIPQIMEEIQMVLQKTKAELQKIPSPVSTDPVLEVTHLISDFSDDLYRHAEGFNHYVHQANSGSSVEENQFVIIAEAHEAFRQEIRATAPNFRPFNNPRPRLTKRDVTSDIVPQEISPASPAQNFQVEYEFESRAPRTLAPLEENVDLSQPGFLLPEEAAHSRSSQVPVYLDDVVACVQNATTRELPGYYPFYVLQKLVGDSTEKWEVPTGALVDVIHLIVVEHRSTLMKKYFAQFTEGGLRQMVSNIMQAYMERRREECMERVKWLLELEAYAFTLNKHYYEDYRNKFLGYYRDERRKHLGHYHNAPSEPWNPNQFAIEIMATVRAYFQVAYKRVVDIIPLAIDRELVRVQKRGVQDALFEGLNITGPNARARCQNLLAEPAETVARREELRVRLVRLEAAQRELLEV